MKHSALIETPLKGTNVSNDEFVTYRSMFVYSFGKHLLMEKCIAETDQDEPFARSKKYEQFGRIVVWWPLKLPLKSTRGNDTLYTKAHCFKFLL